MSRACSAWIFSDLNLAFSNRATKDMPILAAFWERSFCEANFAFGKIEGHDPQKRQRRSRLQWRRSARPLTLGSHGSQNIQQVPHLFSVAELFQDDSLRLTEDSPLAHSRDYTILCKSWTRVASGGYAAGAEEKGRYRQGIHAAVCKRE